MNSVTFHFSQNFSPLTQKCVFVRLLACLIVRWSQVGYPFETEAYKQNEYKWRGEKVKSVEKKININQKIKSIFRV